MGTATRVLAVVLLIASGLSSAQTIDNRTPLSPTEKSRLCSFLKTHWQSPEDYVIGKFKDHDVIFLGEQHRIKHDVEFVQGLIPLLYRAGIHNLGLEFTNEEDQAVADAVVTADTYDEVAVRQMYFRSFVAWGYKEYEDLYLAAWKLNHSLPKNAPKFRIVNLGYRVRWDLMTANPTPEIKKQVWHKGDGDSHMAEVIKREFMAKGEKALIYCGIHHAFTRYRMPQWDPQANRWVMNSCRTGNIVSQSAPGRVFTIYLHAPWPGTNFEIDGYPVQGKIDQVMSGFKDKRVGFDVIGTPFAELRAPDSYYALGYDDFRLDMWTDGYIFQKPFKDYVGVTVDPNFITEHNLKEAIAWIPNVDARRQDWTVESMLQSMQRDANMKERIKGLE